MLIGVSVCTKVMSGPRCKPHEILCFERVCDLPAIPPFKSSFPLHGDELMLIRRIFTRPNEGVKFDVSGDNCLFLSKTETRERRIEVMENAGWMYVQSITGPAILDCE